MKKVLLSSLFAAAGICAVIGDVQAVGSQYLSFDLPAGWKREQQIKTSPIVVSGEGGPAHFKDWGGGAPAVEQVKRWSDSHPGEKKLSETKVAGFPVTRLELRRKDGSMLLGAVVDSKTYSRGAYKQGTHVFELFGPEKTVLAARGDFDKMLESIRLE
jgi:hypothetical protein